MNLCICLIFVNFYLFIQSMHLSRQLTSNGRDFANLQKYQNHQPSILNCYFAINLITAVDKLPPLSRPSLQNRQANLQQNRTESKNMTENTQSQIEHKTLAYNHQIDRLNQDIEINQYTISNVLLGRGAHSTVRLAKSDDKFYAMKILWFQKIKKKYFITQKQLIKMINAQINMLLKLKHPNIIQFREAIFSLQKERIFIVLQYCPKGSLFNVAANKLTVEDEEWREEVRGYFVQMVEGLAYIHQNNIIHRDIKPENMLLNDQGQVKIIDFNISETVSLDGMIKINNKFIGTKGYAAPQLIIGIDNEKTVDGRSLDIWSLGISLLELLERRHPFSIKTLEELHKYLSQDIPINEQYDPELKDLLKRMLKKTNEGRIKIKDIAKHAWVRKSKK